MVIKAKPTCPCFNSKFDGNKNLSDSSQPFLFPSRLLTINKMRENDEENKKNNNNNN